MLPASRGDPRYFAEWREGLLSSARLLMGSIEVCGLIGSENSRRQDAKLSDQERFDNKTKLLVSLLTISAFFFVLFLFYFSYSLHRVIILPCSEKPQMFFSTWAEEQNTLQTNKNVKTTLPVTGIVPLGLNKRFLTGHLRRQ